MITVGPQRDVASEPLAMDAARLAGRAAAIETLLAGLPPRPERDAAGHATADAALAAVRADRRAFLARHAEAVYDILTDDRTRYLRISELVYAAADRFPGLVPTRAQMDVERGHRQADKDGREIDQGIFCGAVLRSPRCGRHLLDAMLRPTVRATDLASVFHDTGRIELSTVVVERHGEAGHVTFHNGHCLNAENGQLIADLEVAVDLILLDNRVRVGVLRGGPVTHPRHLGRRVFSAGINLTDLRNGAISFVDFLLTREAGYLSKIARGLLAYPDGGAWTDRTVSKPWVAAVDGFAIGGGMQLLLVMDHVIAEKEAYLSLPAAEEGIVPGLGNLRLTRHTGARLARKVILGGARIEADSPEGTLICDEVLPAAQVDAAVDRAIRHLAAPAVVANRRMLQIAEEPVDLFREYLAEFAVAQSARAYSADVLAKVEQRWAQSQERGRI